MMFNKMADSYTSLKDPHLGEYFSHPRRRRELIRAGVMRRDGAPVDDKTYLLNDMRRERERQEKETAIRRILAKRYELETSKQTLLTRAMDDIVRIEKVIKIKNDQGSIRPRIINSSSIDVHTSGSKHTGSPRHAVIHTGSPRHGVIHTGSPRHGVIHTQHDSDSSDVIDCRRTPSPSHSRSIQFGRNNRTASAPAASHPTNNRISLSYGARDDKETRYIVEPTSDPSNAIRPVIGCHVVALDHITDKDDRDDNTQSGRQTGSQYIQRTGVPSLHLNGYHNSNLLMRGKSGRTLSPLNYKRTSPNNRRRYIRPTSEYTRRVTVPLDSFENETENWEPVEVRMRYFGDTLNLVSDGREPFDEILVEQQHCGGNSLRVFDGKVMPGEEFSFVSHRHPGYPFSLTIHVNGRQDSRVSTCCEYKHSRNMRLGGKNGHFAIVDIVGNSPCRKCLRRLGKKNGKNLNLGKYYVEGDEEYGGESREQSSSSSYAHGRKGSAAHYPLGKHHRKSANQHDYYSLKVAVDGDDDAAAAEARRLRATSSHVTETVGVSTMSARSGDAGGLRISVDNIDDHNS